MLVEEGVLSAQEGKVIAKLIESTRENPPTRSFFYEVVILPNQLSTRDDISRRTYLQEYAPPDLWERVMAYWQANLHNFVPRPDSSQSSDYTKNAEWMSALKELAPQNYDSLLSQWKVQYKRRPNLWKAMRNLGLD